MSARGRGCSGQTATGGQHHGTDSQHTGNPGPQPPDHGHRRRRRGRQRGQQHDRQAARGLRVRRGQHRRPGAAAEPGARNKLQLGARVTEGLGAGARPEVGAAAAEESIEEIVERLSRLPHVLHHRRHGRRHRHRRGADHRQGGARDGRADRRRRDQALPVRGRAADEAGRERRRGAAEARRHADHHPEPEPVPAGQREDHLHRGLRAGRRRALPGRQGRHRPDGPARHHQPRLRRRPLGDERDGQGDDGHRRGAPARTARCRPPRRRSPTRCSTRSA